MVVCPLHMGDENEIYLGKIRIYKIYTCETQYDVCLEEPFLRKRQMIRITYTVFVYLKIFECFDMKLNILGFHGPIKNLNIDSD